MLNLSIDKNNPTPFYYQIEENIRALIAQGVLKPGDMLPPEISLSQQLGVSRITIRQALSDLTNAGLLIRQRAVGTFVAQPRKEVPFIRERLGSLTEEMAQLGLELKSRVLQQELITATGDIMYELEMKQPAKVVLIRRLRSVKGIPLALETAYHPYDRFPDLLTLDLTDCSIYEILNKRYNARPVFAHDRFVASLVTGETARLLDINDGAPVMRLMRTAKDRQGLPMEYSISLYRADRHQFSIHYREE
ncbi:MAG: GntR family transcriptional regulator [Anaerolineales bacterium]|nr:GntR family transcriptional regulator [Anaerolineales bacterium]